MAEILSSGVNLFTKDTSTGNGNTIIGAAVPTDSVTEGIAKEAGQTGIFVYTDKSFTVYFHYGSSWVEYMSVDVNDADWTGSVNVPWVNHDTHGVVDAMYFKTAEADHELRLVTFITPIFIDATPGDGNLDYDGLFISVSGATVNVDNALYGNETQFVRFERPSAAGYSAGETITLTKTGKCVGSHVIIDGVEVSATEVYTGEPEWTTAITFIAPASITASSVIDVYYEHDYVYIPAIVTSGLVFHIDATDPESYPGTGTVWTSLVNSTNVGTLISSGNDPANGVQLVDGHMHFDGSDDRVEFDTTQNNITFGTMTIETWFRIDHPSGTANYDCLFANSPKNQGGLSMQIMWDRFYLHGMSNSPAGQYGGNFMYAQPSIQGSNIWQQVVVAFDGADRTKARLWLNGQPHPWVNTNIYGANSGFAQPTTDPYIIGNNVEGSLDFGGDIDIIRHYDRVLTDAEVLKNYDADKSKFGL